MSIAEPEAIHKLPAKPAPIEPGTPVLSKEGPVALVDPKKRGTKGPVVQAGVQDPNLDGEKVGGKKISDYEYSHMLKETLD